MESTEPAPRRRLLPRALPRLQGRALLAFTILWLTLLPLAVAMPVVSVVTRVQRADTPVWLPIGLAVDSAEHQIHVYAAASREARAAGVRAGDTIVGVDGHPVRGGVAGFAEIRPLLLRPEGTRFAISLRGSDGRIRTVRLTRRQAHIDEPFERSPLTARTV